MILREVKRLLASQRRMTLSQLIAETGDDKASVIAALEYFIHRGNVYREFERASGVTCGTMCKNCPISTACVLGKNAMSGMEIFVWIEKESIENVEGVTV